MKPVYENFAKGFSVLQDEGTRKLFIEVMCGEIGWFEVRVPLTQEEVNEFKRDPAQLKYLARKIFDDPENYRRERNAKSLDEPK